MPKRTIALVSLVLGLGCRSGSSQAPEPPPVEGRFPHARHAVIACVECHQLDDVLAARPALPGKVNHAPCDESGCHQSDFLSDSAPLCKICHDVVDPIGGATKAAPYPPNFGPYALAAEFDHATHLDFGRMEKSVGFHISCSDCHLNSQGSVMRPGHRECARCHAPEAAPANAPPLSACDRCHLERASPPLRQRKLIVDDLVFSHESHRVDRKQTQIRCIDCHQGSPGHVGTGNHPLPPMETCVECHDDTDRVRPGQRMRICETCHTSRRARFGLLAPRSHLPATERPLDHTLAFRRDHAQDALREASRCAGCHTVLSGSSRDVCDECHGVMRPTDHTVTWREYDHGQEAATESDRCTTCHSGDFCTTCHQQVPRSHIPLASFREGHAVPAMINPRACITCHPQQAFCSRPGCHGVTP